jgi:NAD(P)-dependent dehydrogenase (short-subunit alcohol dehydrogenase family)
MYVVTGGTGAIGFALCVTLAQQGHPVLLTARDSERGLQAARHVATKSCCPTDMVRFAQLNVADERSVQAIAEKVLPRLGPISAIFNNAGVCIRGTSPSVLRSTFDVNFDGALRVANACRPFMTKSSAIINISSGDGELVYLCSEAQDRLKNAHSWEVGA